MRKLIWTEQFRRAFKRITQLKPELDSKIQYTLELLAENPFHSTLHSHKLKGELSGAWACTVDYDNRILFEFVYDHKAKEEKISLLTIGKHDRVY
jgi:addiction module RelE/StbE family toxin